MKFKAETENPECISLQIKLCGEVFSKVKEKQEEHFKATGQKLSKRLAVLKLILGK